VSSNELLPVYGTGVLVGALPLAIAASATTEAAVAAWVFSMIAADTAFATGETSIVDHPG
jgi:hypothetical protein